MGKRDPIVPSDPNMQPVPGLYVPRSKAFFQTKKDNTKPYTDLDMIDYGEMLRSGEIQPGEIRGRAQHDYEKQMSRFDGLEEGSDPGAGFANATLTGASLGTTIGNAVPVIGTGVGAAAGAIAGAAANIFTPGDYGHRTTDDDRQRWAAPGGTLDQNKQAIYQDRGLSWNPQFVDQAAQGVAKKFGDQADQEELLAELRRQRGY